MTALPSATTAVAPTATEGTVKSFLTGVHDYLSGLFGETGVAADARTALGVTPLTYSAIINTLGYTPAINSHTHSMVMDYNTVGSYCLACLAYPYGLSPGDSIAGSSLLPAGMLDGGKLTMTGPSLSGTWRILSFYSPEAQKASIVLAQRIS